ncbi:hypothetical protein Aca07nite_48960 [Actinoplanes capillaceus]|uniref:Uncharacterized protein n=1 Tax=Actinoplanes campanulatus TaxID=113559 RepID=A0ABQ3WN12_9ACTN|nr:hypothetical protein [Actinoplanes capillaceus]GID47621.1 hypothetical protein Aca07nite_48960 [Actinoplanes capillaceus]
MADRRGSWPAALPPPPGYLPPRNAPQPSPQFAAMPPRPTYREPHPVTAAPVLTGLAATTAWFVLFGSLGSSLASYAWWTIGAALAAWAVALLLAVLGDRGVAVGVAVASGLALSIALLFVTLRWVATYDWPLW